MAKRAHARQARAEGSMTEQQDSELHQAIERTVALIGRYQDRVLGEQNTKASLIEPILEALGWAIRDPDEVHREYKSKPKDNPVDYALSLLREPRLFVEAKPLGETLADRKWIGQVVGYASMAGVQWCVLSDGDEYRFYNAAAPVDAEEKLFCLIKLTEAPVEDAARTLALISRANMEKNILDVRWNAYFVDRRVKQACQEMFATEDRGLIRLVRRKVGKLTPREIAESLRRLDVRIGSPAPVPPDPGAKTRKAAKQKKGERKPRKAGKAMYGVNLQDLIGAGLLSPPLPLFRQYRGTRLQATVLPDGKVEFQGTAYDSCSTPAEVARSMVTGRRMHTNGWVFWQYSGPDGKTHLLADLRKRFLAMKRGSAGSP
jgi:predicted type IV restriction endonuclease